MTPRELIDELDKIVKVHPEAENHTMAGCCDCEDERGGGFYFNIVYLRYDKRHKRIVLEG